MLSQKVILSFPFSNIPLSSLKLHFCIFPYSSIQLHPFQNSILYLSIFLHVRQNVNFYISITPRGDHNAQCSRLPSLDLLDECTAPPFPPQQSLTHKVNNDSHVSLSFTGKSSNRPMCPNPPIPLPLMHQTTTTMYH